MDLDEILYGVYGIEYHLYCILFNSVASTFPKWRTFKLLRCVLLLNRLLVLDEGLYGGDDIEGDLVSILLNPIAFQNGGRLNSCAAFSF
jgi:hypothetical protein